MQYYPYREIVPELDGTILRHMDGIVSEIDDMVKSWQWKPWPEADLVQRSEGPGAWTVVPLLHTFPGWDTTKSVWIDAHTALLPRTTELLRGVPNIRTALLSKMKAQTLLTSGRVKSSTRRTFSTACVQHRAETVAGRSTRGFSLLMV